MGTEVIVGSFTYDTCHKPCHVNDDHEKLIFTISLSFGILSLLGSLAIIGHALAKRIYYAIEVRPLFHLSIANVGFCVSLIILSSLDPCAKKAYLWFIAFEEIFYLTAFFLTANYAMVVYLCLKDKVRTLDNESSIFKQASVRRGLKLAYCLSWSLPPLLLVPVTVALLSSSVEFNLCHLCPYVVYCPNDDTDKGTLFRGWFLRNFGSLLVIVLYLCISVVLLMFYYSSWLVCGELLKREDLQSTEKDAVKGLRKRVTSYTTCFYYCWTPTFVISVLDLVVDVTDLKSLNYTFLFYLWSVTAPIQGFLLAAIYFHSAYRQGGRAFLMMTRKNSDEKPFATGSTHRYYGTGEQRSRWPSTKGASYFPTIKENAEASEGEERNDAASFHRSSSLTHSSSYQNKKRSPSFMAVLRDTNREWVDDT